MTQPILDTQALADWRQAHPLWQLDQGKLHRVFVFKDFVAAFDWMSQVAEDAEALCHHPEWLNVYRSVTVWLTTHDAGGLTALDLDLAQRMESHYAPHARIS